MKKCWLRGEAASTCRVRRTPGGQRVGPAVDFSPGARNGRLRYSVQPRDPMQNGRVQSRARPKNECLNDAKENVLSRQEYYNNANCCQKLCPDLSSCRNWLIRSSPDTPGYSSLIGTLAWGSSSL